MPTTLTGLKADLFSKSLNTVDTVRYRVDIFLEHEHLGRMWQCDRRQPIEMGLCPHCFSRKNNVMPEQEGSQLLHSYPECTSRIDPSPYQIPQGFIFWSWNIYRRELTCPMQPGLMKGSPFCHFLNGCHFVGEFLKER